MSIDNVNLADIVDPVWGNEVVDRINLLQDTGRFADSAAATLSVGTPLVGMKYYNTTDGIEYRHDGSTWKKWESTAISWTPTWNNVSLGTGGVTTGDYRFVAGHMEIRAEIRFGSVPNLNSGTTQLVIPDSQTIASFGFKYPLGMGYFIRLGGSSSDYTFIPEAVPGTANIRFKYAARGDTINTANTPGELITGASADVTTSGTWQMFITGIPLA